MAKLNRVFKNDKERLKEAVKTAAEDFIDMLDCLDDDPNIGLDYTSTVIDCGIEICVKISGSAEC